MCTQGPAQMYGECSRWRWSCSVTSHSWQPHGPCSPPGSSIHVTFQVRILEQVATSYSRGSSQPRDRTCVSCAPPALQADSLPSSHQGNLWRWSHLLKTPRANGESFPVTVPTGRGGRAGVRAHLIKLPCPRRHFTYLRNIYDNVENNKINICAAITSHRYHGYKRRPCVTPPWSSFLSSLQGATSLNLVFIPK